MTVMCTLCQNTATEFTKDKQRRYFKCGECELIFADPRAKLTGNSEKQIYDLHQNDPSDEGYRRFLRLLTEPLLERVAAGAEGLDFGCGPGPTLNLMLEEAGIHMALYDIFYYPDKAPLEQRYDLVTCTEVVEHFNTPATSWPTLVSLLKEGALLAVMTSLFTRETPEAFLAWQYKNDPTHVSFYTPKTMQWLANHFGLECEIVSQRVIFFRRAPSTRLIHQRASAVSGGR
ncbi:class I SAM-dependent methyltransferase [Pseudidiomarina homiensis]|uniref:2-polyprenyl-3-methyl-5-hydroxy-6-metoxy-1, 4-benzoquinol methylase n=1 Tax=Pseudidiomarina homiensis TaxID=364198 RepID=A0A432Y6V7_9GAMM|nr:class I SAM-dependent methyltransferase [Pseudidiomarina homiensis]RUO56677.1 2-polyprenyl-3-methyl-5-hydroxy-6-metoxy-1,4-benzoquinol methylase [Pseudidiomarina homiensis]